MIANIVDIIIGVLIADSLLGWLRGVRKRAHMRKLNKLSQLKRAKRASKADRAALAAADPAAPRELAR